MANLRRNSLYFSGLVVAGLSGLLVGTQIGTPTLSADQKGGLPETNARVDALQARIAAIEAAIPGILNGTGGGEESRLDP